LSLQIRKYRYSGYVYDLTTRTHHNFYAGSINVHNCAKKRYVIRVHDSEGVRFAEPQLKIMGSEAIRSSTPKVCREMIREAMDIILTKDEQSVQEYIRKCREKFYTLSFEDVAFPRSVNLYKRSSNDQGGDAATPYADASSIYAKSTPIQVKGALLYNHWINKLGLGNVYETINDGEKIKFCYLKMPNKIRDKVIACPGILPPELMLDQAIDYETQFEKAFINPITHLLDAVGWTVEKKATLEGLFG